MKAFFPIRFNLYFISITFGFTIVASFASGFLADSRRAGSFFFKPYNSLVQRASSDSVQESSVSDSDEIAFRAIAKRYLSSKFQECNADGNDCKVFRGIEEVKNLLRSVLPPVSIKELEAEVDLVISKIGRTSTDDFSESEYVNAVVDNSYWSEAGPFVVKELIFLDCLHQYYFGNRKQLIPDEDYEELKEQLTWEGSMATTLTGKEAQFITAVAASRRGEAVMSDSDYEKLKNDLLAQDSWVVKRQPDPLEKLGLKTFLGYLHRSL